jgi:hypothetical protein
LSKKLTAPVQIWLGSVLIAGTANLAFLPPSSFASPTQSEFMSEMHAHRNLVKIVGLYIFREKPELFSRLTEEIVSRYLDLHDLPKVLPLGMLKRFESDQSQTIAERLILFYGKRRENMTRDEFANLMKTTSDLNRIEDAIKNSFFEKHRVKSPQKGELLFLEETADFAVTELTRQLELPGFNAVMILEQKGEVEEASLLTEMLPVIRDYLMSRKDCQSLLSDTAS